MKDTTTVQTEGTNAVQRAKQLLSGYENTDIVAVEVRLVHDNGEADDEQETPHDDDTDKSTSTQRRSSHGKTFKHLTEEDRRLKEPSESSKPYDVLKVIPLDGEDAASSRDIGERYGEHISRISPALTKLYEYKMVDREKKSMDTGGARYLYWVSEHGKTLLKERGDL